MGVTVYVDYPARDRVAAMSIGGMTVVERVLREAARAGASRAIIRADPDGLPALRGVPLEVEVVPAGSPVPDGAAAVAGNVVAGVAISDDQSRRAASRALFQTCRRPYDGLGDRYVIRALSLRITAALCRLGVRPNQVTAINILVGLAACLVVREGTPAAFVLAGALMFAQVVLDSCDGELARIRFMHSRLGMVLDNVSDDVIDNLFIAMLGVGIGGAWAPIAIAAACARGLAVAMIHLDVARRGRVGDIMAFEWWFDRSGGEVAARYSTGMSAADVARAIGRRDLYVLIFAATCAVQLPEVGLAIGIAISASYFALAAVHVAMTARR